MASLWTLETLTEFDLRMHRHAPENAVYSPEVVDAAPDRSGRLFHWMQQLREPEDEALRLSRIAVQSERFLQLGLWILSLLAGGSAAAALLRYEGERLINISAYLGILVGGQMLLLIFLGLGTLFFRERLRRLQTLFMPQMVQALPSPLSLRAWSWRIFKTFQQAGIAFNLGILLLTLWKVLTFDLAFGWASTLNADGEDIHRLVQTLAMPWGGRFTPDPQQIEQSRIALRSGLSGINPGATASWWPFLVLCVTVYALLPRACLTLYAGFRLRRQLEEPDFSSANCENLYLNLTRKPLNFSGSESPSPSSKAESAPRLKALRPRGPVRLEVPDELLDPTGIAAFSETLQKKLQVEINESAGGILKVVEVWQPPLEETLRGLRELRQRIGPGNDLILLAVGYPTEEPGAFFLPPDPQDLAIWETRLGELQDPALGLLPWREI